MNEMDRMRCEAQRQMVNAQMLADAQWRQQQHLGGLSPLSGLMGGDVGFGGRGGLGWLPRGASWPGAPRPRPKAKFKNIKPKPGYILDGGEIRAKVRTDYTKWEQVVIWWAYLTRDKP